MNIECIGFVTVVSIIITTITAIYISLYLSVLYQHNKVAFWILSPPFGVAVLLMLFSYFRAVCSSPGNPERTLVNRKFSAGDIEIFKQRAETHKSNNKQRRSKARRLHDPEEIHEMTQISYCDKCQLVKLPRVHHCKICNACIIRMDHHCPWIGNCVGRHNHKFFILFLLYATIGLGIVWISVAIEALSDWQNVSKVDSELATPLVGVAGVAALLLFLSIGGLLFSQLWASSDNLTTLESFVPGINNENPYDFGEWKQNFKQIFGSEYWWIPVKPDISSDNVYVNCYNRMQEKISYQSPEQYGNTISSDK